MLFQEYIAAKRDGRELTDAQMSDVVTAITSESASDAQVAAFAMAVLLKGLTTAERVALTTAMRDSGDVLSWDLPGPVVDKHSTGGVGDNTSLMLAPALAACGVYVPMVSGRGLGHTGGTLDKFDAIPGYQTQPDNALFNKVVRDVGCAIIGQTGTVAPADKRLYGIRDVTATVESIDLICASILSKKLAAGLDALVLDVKVGNGAFMADPDMAHRLAEVLVAVANDAGCKTTALVTDMNEPLASAAGNALEMRNAVRFLTGDDVDSRLWDVTVALGAEILVTCGQAGTIEAARDSFTQALESGAAAERFARMVRALGGPADFIENHDHHLAHADTVMEVYATRPGFVSAIDTRSLGLAVVELGGGRRRAEDPINYAVGLDHLAGIGARADRDIPIARVHARTVPEAEQAAATLRAAYAVSDTPPDENPLIRERLAP